MSELGNTTSFSWAIFSMYAHLVPQISMLMGEYHRALGKSNVWSTEEDQATGRKAIRNASILGNLVAAAFIIGGACGVALTTLNLEPKMVSMIIGLSYLVGATFLFGLSWRFPEWLEVYHIKPRKSVLPVGCRSVRALQFKVFWSVIAKHLSIYFFFLFFCCGARRGLVAIAMVTGIFVGLLIDVCVYVGKERLKSGRKRMWLIFAMISIVVISSGVLFATGADYINYVWGSKEKENMYAVIAGAFFAWLVAGAIIHVLLWRQTKGHVKEMLEGTDAKSVRQLGKSTKYKNPAGEFFVTKAAPKAVDSAKTAVSKVKDSANTATRRLSGDEAEEEPPSKVVGFAADEPDADAGADEEVGEDTPMEEAQKMEEAQAQAQAPAESEQGGDAEGEDGDKDAMFAEEEDNDGEVEDPTYGSLCKAKFCCCCGGKARCGCGPNRTPQEKAMCCGKWLIWSILSIFSLFLVIVNAGATEQQDQTRELLPLVQEKLYKFPDWMAKEVCAYDGDGTEGSLNENSTITTFLNKDVANQAGYLVLHCGKCGHCSTWPNVAYQYTTRNFLAESSRKCAMNSFLSGGGKNSTRDCHMSPPVNFDFECGTCWAETAHCAMRYCSFIGVQSFFINTFTNLAVEPDDITGATCNEANCEAWEYPNNFANCSGASRRKMNIQNTIKRPENQQCLIVDVDWAVLFPGQ